MPRSTSTTAATVLASLLLTPVFCFSQTLIDNDQVRVVKVTDQPHQKGAPHEHKSNRVMVYLQGGSQTITPQGGKPQLMRWKAGEVKWSPASGMHTSEITSDAPVTIVEVEVKKQGDPSKTINTPLDPLKVDPKVYHLEFENAQVRVTRVRIPAKQNVPEHEHVLNRVVVYLTDQNGTMTTPDGKTDTAQHKAGEASWGGPTKHKESNLRDQLFEAVVVELKN
jgi:quercetin dioxygenase-like cupin family protein